MKQIKLMKRNTIFALVQKLQPHRLLSRKFDRIFIIMDGTITFLEPIYLKIHNSIWLVKTTKENIKQYIFLQFASYLA